MNTKIRATQPKHVPDTKGKMIFLWYTSGQQDLTLINMSEVVEDMLELPRFKQQDTSWSAWSSSPRFAESSAASYRPRAKGAGDTALHIRLEEQQKPHHPAGGSQLMGVSSLHIACICFVSQLI